MSYCSYQNTVRRYCGGYGFYKRRLKEIQGHGRKDASLIKIMTEAYTLTGFNPAEDGEQCCAHKKTRLEI